MPTNLVEAPTFDSAVAVPVDRTDPRSVASIQPAFQALANRTTFLKAEQDSGVRRVRSVADVTALKAVTSMAHGEHREVVDYGLYRYDSASTSAEALPFVVQPTGAPTGRWRHTLFAAAGLSGATGIASLASDAKVNAAQLRGYLSGSFDGVPSGVSSSETTFNVSGNTQLTATTLVTAPVVGTLARGVGDQLFARANFAARRGTANGVVFLLVVSTTAGDTVVEDFDLPLSTVDSWPINLSGAVGKAVAPDTVSSVQLRAYAATPGSVLVYKPSAFRPQVLYFKG